MMRKKGAVNWTIGKLLNIVLLTVLLALVVYGMTTGGFGPLLEKMEMKFEEVQVLLGIKEDSFSECSSVDVADLGGGEEFLRILDLDGRDVVLSVCDGVCNLSLGGEDFYRVMEGVFEVSKDGEWVADDFFIKDASRAKFDWGLYNGAADILDDTDVREIYNKMVTRSFSLYGDGAGAGDDEVFAVWRNGVWAVHSGGKVVYETDDISAIDLFVSMVDDWYNDAVLYKEVSPEIRGMGSKRISPSEKEIFKIKNGMIEGEWRPISELVGGENLELNSPEKVKNLKIRFSEIKRVAIADAVLGGEDVSRLKEAVEGKSFEVGSTNGHDSTRNTRDDSGEPSGEPNDVFVMKLVLWSDVGYVISLVSGERRYGLRFNAYEELVRGDVALRKYPLSLVSYVENDEGARVSGSEEGDERSYKLPERYFEEEYRKHLAGQFLVSKCR